MTVADLEEATAFFTGVLGCRTLYTMGPFAGAKGPFMRMYANADVRSVVHHVRVLRSPFLNVELFQASSPRQRPLWPDLYDVGGWSLTGVVDDLGAAVARLEAEDVYVLEEGSDSCHAMTPWGLHLELVPAAGRAAEPTTSTGPGEPTEPTTSTGPGEPTEPSTTAGAGPAPWDPTAPGPGVEPFPPDAGALPGFRGFERLTVTVADLDEAAGLLTGVLGFEAVGAAPAPADRSGPDLRAHANVDARARPARACVLRSPYLNVELVECPPYPGQNRLWPAMFDVGGWHLALYVDDVDAAVADLAATDVHLLGGKKPAYRYEAGRDACTVHALAPFGLLFELVTYPHGRDRAGEHAGPAWCPPAPDRRAASPSTPTAVRE